MEVTQQFFDRFKRQFAEALAAYGPTTDNVQSLNAFDRAALATVLNGEPTATTSSKPNKRPKAGSQAARDRARKAAETRRANREKVGDGEQGGGE